MRHTGYVDHAWIVRGQKGSTEPRPQSRCSGQTAPAGQTSTDDVMRVIGEAQQMRSDAAGMPSGQSGTLRPSHRANSTTGGGGTITFPSGRKRPRLELTRHFELPRSKLPGRRAASKRKPLIKQGKGRRPPGAMPDSKMPEDPGKGGLQCPGPPHRNSARLCWGFP